MAIITSHTLNGLDGTHAAGISVSLVKVGTAAALLTSQTEISGRLSLEIAPDNLDPNATYELVFDTGTYWSQLGHGSRNVINEIVLRFDMPDISGHYHMPVIVSPYSYSTWKSG